MIYNKLIFNDEVVSSRNASFIINSFALSWSKAIYAEKISSVSCGGHAPQSLNQCTGPDSCWSPPALDFFKLNFDGSKLSNGNASLAFVIREFHGDAILVWGRPLGRNSSILKAEAWALKDGIFAALSLNISKIIIEGDNLAVVNAVRKIWKVPWKICNIINDIDFNLYKFDFSQVQHYYREANKVADLMAHRGHTFLDLQYCYPSL